MKAFNTVLQQQMMERVSLSLVNDVGGLIVHG